MGKCPILFLLFFLLPIVTASGLTTVFDGWAATGNHQTTDGSNFTLIVNEKANKALLIIDNLSLIIASQSCTSGSRLEACILNISEGETFDRERWVFIYEAYLKISRTVPDIFFEAQSFPNSLNLRESSVSRISFKNNGEEPAKDVEVFVRYPGVVTIENVEGCVYADDVISWRGSLEPLQENECVVDIRGENPGYGNIDAQMFYFDGFGTQKLTADERLTVDDYLVSQRSRFANSTFNLSSEGFFTVTISPRKLGFERLDNMVTFPEGIEVLSTPPGVDLIQGSYHYTGQPESKFNLTFLLRFNFLGNFSIQDELSYSIGEIEHKLSESYGFKVIGNEVQISSIPPKIKAGEGEFQVVNPSSSPISKVGVDYTVANKTMRGWVDTIERKSHLAIPIFYSGTDSTLPVYVKVTYTTSVGQQLSVSSELNYLVESEERTNVSSNISDSNAGAGSNQTKEQQEAAKAPKHNIFLPLLGIFVLLFIISGLALLAKIRKKL